MSRIFTALAVICFLYPLHPQAQSNVDLGQGVQNNFDYGVDGAYSYNQRTEKTQCLITASELEAQGIGTGYISGLGFFVTELANGTELLNFSLSIGHSSNPITATFQTGLTPVFGPTALNPTAGYNVHTFSSPFLWDGVSDIMVQTCYENNFSGPGNNSTSIRFSSFNGAGNAESDHNSNDSACDDISSEVQVNGRPDIRLLWESSEVPPVADFSIASFASCSGSLSLVDQSSNFPESWLWYFGDGSTSADPSPTYTYLTDGTYTISLVVTNSFGTDSTSIEAAVTVAFGGTFPIPASCIPSSQDPSLGFGLTSVTLAGSTYTSTTGFTGYEDLTCDLFTLDQGVQYTMNVTAGGGSINQVSAWIDYNADGIFTLNERFMNQQVSASGSITFTPSLNALTDSTLRMRILGDFYLIGTQGPCANLTGGQAEDYSIRINTNTEAPTAQFSSDPDFSCDGVIQFYDESDNVPTGWFWLFGDGGFSSSSDPIHTYTESGTYTVSLTAQNSFGTDDTVMVDVVTVDLSQALTPACAVNTISYCCGYGLTSVNLAGMINNSTNASVGYEDYTCGSELTVAEGESFTFFANTGLDNPQDVAVFIDFDNSGTFGISERVFISTNANTHSGTITIPLSVPVVETRLRLRVIADFVGNNNAGCTNTQFGQAEDYTIIILPDLTLPAADFNANSQFSCSGEISFNNLSSANSESFIWYFGDGNMSSETDPSYTYLSEGFFTISLVAINDNGQDSIAFVDYIEIDFEGVCDTLSIQTTGTGVVITDCNGYLTDDGGPDGNYSSNSNGTQTIQTALGNNISLDFINFSFQNNNDYLYIYDGPDATAPLIGQFTGNGLPNGGTIESTGNSITLRQTSNFFNNLSGFLLSWACSPLGLEDYAHLTIEIFPNPATDQLRITSYEEYKIKGLTILDIQGRIVLRPKLDNQGIVNLEALEDGNYILMMEMEENMVPVKFIIQH